MSLNNFQLPPFVLQDLYRSSLIDIKLQEKIAVKPASKTFTILGDNRRKILIVIENDDTLYLPDDQLNLLLGILAACQLTMEDVAILNIKKNKLVTYKTITKELKSEMLFLFGVTPHQIELPLDFPNYQIQAFNNQIYLSAPMLSQFQDNKTEKTKLWNCLKQIFAI